MPVKALGHLLCPLQISGVGSAQGLTLHVASKRLARRGEAAQVPVMRRTAVDRAAVCQVLHVFSPHGPQRPHLQAGKGSFSGQDSWSRSPAGREIQVSSDQRNPRAHAPNRSASSQTWLEGP